MTNDEIEEAVDLINKLITEKVLFIHSGHSIRIAEQVQIDAASENHTIDIFG